MVDGKSMKKKMITIATEGILHKCEAILNNHRGYAARQGLEYEVIQKAHWEQIPACFSKVYEIERAMAEGAEIVIWADADVVFMDWKADLTKLLAPDYMLAAYHQQNWKSWTYLCAGLMVWRNTPQARAFIAEWAKRCLAGTMKDHPWEQWFLDELVRETKYDKIRPCNAREIGCFCPEIWHDGVVWKPGMPTIHMAGPSTWENRADVFAKNYLTRVVQ